MGSMVGHASMMVLRNCSMTGVNFPPASSMKFVQMPLRLLVLLVRPSV